MCPLGHLTTVAAKRFPGAVRARQSCRFLERGLLHPPQAALRLFPPRGEGFSLGNRRNPNNHQGSALKRGRRGTVTPLLRQKNQTTPEQQDKQEQEIKEFLEPLVLSQLSPSRSEVFRSATERSEALSAEMPTFL